MAITWEVSHPERLIIAYGKEAVTATDILYSADMFARTGINTYRKLFDLTRLTGMMPQLDMKLVGERMRVRATGQSFGPIALVVSTDGVAGATRIFQAAAEAERPVETFRDFAAAREWPDRTAPPEGIAEVDHDQDGRKACMPDRRDDARDWPLDIGFPVSRDFRALQSPIRVQDTCLFPAQAPSPSSKEAA